MENLYQYAVLKRPTEEERKVGAKTEIILPPSKWILAKSEEEVVLRAAQQIPTVRVDECADQLEVVVRPF